MIGTLGSLVFSERTPVNQIYFSYSNVYLSWPVITGLPPLLHLKVTSRMQTSLHNSVYGFLSDYLTKKEATSDMYCVLALLTYLV